MAEVAPQEQSIEKAEKADSDAYDTMAQNLRDKILFGLSVYPFLMPSMLHVFLGTATPKAIWKDVVLEKLLTEGLVVKEEVSLTSPHERTQTYTVLHLATNTYTYTPPSNEAPQNDEGTPEAV